MRVLSNPEKTILENDGMIFFAISAGKAVGTVALTHHGKKVYELNKMAVTKSMQGKSIGNLLLKKVLDLLKKKKAKELYLENKSLSLSRHTFV